MSESSNGVVPTTGGAPVGNENAASHGAYSDRLVSPRAREIVASRLDAFPHLDAVQDGPALARYAVTAARCERVWEWLADQEDDTFSDVEKGTVHAALDRLARWERQCAEAEHRLGITPLQRVKLGLAKMAALDVGLALSEPDPEIRRGLLARLGLLDGGSDD